MMEKPGSTPRGFTPLEEGKAIGSAINSSSSVDATARVIEQANGKPEVSYSLVGRIHNRLMALAERTAAIKDDARIAQVAREEASTRYYVYMIALEIVGEEEARETESSSVAALQARVHQDKKEINLLHAVAGDLAGQLVEAQKNAEFLDVEREKWRSESDFWERRVHQLEQENARLRGGIVTEHKQWNGSWFCHPGCTNRHDGYHVEACRFIKSDAAAESRVSHLAQENRDLHERVSVLREMKAGYELRADDLLPSHTRLRTALELIAAIHSCDCATIDPCAFCIASEALKVVPPGPGSSS